MGTFELLWFMDDEPTPEVTLGGQVRTHTFDWAMTDTLLFFFLPYILICYIKGMKYIKLYRFLTHLYHCKHSIHPLYYLVLRISLLFGFHMRGCQAAFASGRCLSKYGSTELRAKAFERFCVCGIALAFHCDYHF